MAGLLFWKVFKANGTEKSAYGKATVASAAGAVTYAVLYLFKSYLKGMIVNGLTSQAALVSLSAKLPATVFNGVVAILFAPVLYVAIRAALKKNHLEV